MKKFVSILTVMLVLITASIPAFAGELTVPEVSVSAIGIQAVDKDASIRQGILDAGVSETMLDALMNGTVSADSLAAGPVAYVSTFTELEDALQDPEVVVIYLMNDIQFEGEVVIDQAKSVTFLALAPVNLYADPDSSVHFETIYELEGDLTLNFSNVTLVGYLEGDFNYGGIFLDTTGNVSLNGLWMTGCYNAQLIGENITLRNSDFIDKQQNSSVYARGDFLIDNCVFSGSKSDGGLYAGAEGTGTITNTEITDNQGCGLKFMSDSDYVIKNCVVSGNGGGYGFGGGINATAGTMLIEDTIIADNTSSMNGAGIHVSSIDLSLINCSIINNETEGSGGGIFLQEGNLIIENTQIIENYAAEIAAGALVQFVRNISIKDSYIAENRMEDKEWEYNFMTNDLVVFQLGI